jgi:vancomycin resistance protein VanW
MKRLIPYWLRIEARRAHRWLTILLNRRTFARLRVEDPNQFPFELISHSSKLIRKVDEKWIQLQENKVHNLQLACGSLDGLVIQSSEIFSFCQAVGRTTRRKGYVDGLEMHQGTLVGAPGGGLCQLANLLFWMVLHLDLQILERHRHEMDLFPDDERSVPFGMGATVFHNYLDFQFRNILPQPLLLRVSVERPLLCGSILSSSDKSFSVDIFETHHRFVRRADRSVWRENRVAKRVTYFDGRAPVEEEIAHNVGRVCYDVAEERIERDAVAVPTPSVAIIGQ